MPLYRKLILSAQASVQSRQPSKMDGVCRAVFAAVEGYLRRENVAGNAASQVRVALWVYALLVALVTWASWSIYNLSGDEMTRPLFEKSEQFNDLTNYVDKTAHLYHGAAALGSGFPIFTYPAPAAFVYKILIYTVPGHAMQPYLAFLGIHIPTEDLQAAAAVQTYLVFLAICILGFAFAAWRAGRASRVVRLSFAAAIGTTAVLGYPMWFTADRGNLEGVAWALSAAGLCFLLRGRLRTAAVLIGLAACVKPFSILFLLLLLRRRWFKQAALSLVTTGLVTLAALAALGPNPWKAYQELRPGINLYVAIYVANMAQVEEERFNHSLLDGMKSAALTVKMGGIHPDKVLVEVPILSDDRTWEEHVVLPLVLVYPYVAIAGLGLLLAVFYKMPILNQLTALAVATTLFPLCSGDYTLLALYLPFGALLVFLTREVATGKATFSYASMLTFAVIYALLFSPLTFLMLYAGDAKLLLLLALLVVAARSPMHCAYFDGPAGGCNQSRRASRRAITPDFLPRNQESDEASFSQPRTLSMPSSLVVMGAHAMNLRALELSATKNFWSLCRHGRWV
jgi:hypothetical protein